MKAFSTITAKHIASPCVRFQTNVHRLSFIKMRATPNLSLSFEMAFAMTANVKCTVEQRSQTFYESHTAHQLTLIHITCNSSFKRKCQQNNAWRRQIVQQARWTPWLLSKHCSLAPLMFFFSFFIYLTLGVLEQTAVMLEKTKKSFGRVKRYIRCMRKQYR